MHRYSKTLEHEADFIAGDALASEKKVRQQLKLTLGGFGPKTLDTLDNSLRYVLKIMLEQGVFAREILEQVTGRHSRGSRYVTKRGFRVSFGNNAVVKC